MLTDGDPTYYGTGPSGPGNRTRFAEVENGIFSANALKLKATTIIAVGIGLIERRLGSIGNLRAITGPAAGSDYFVTSIDRLDSLLKRLALSNCAGISIEKSAAPDSYDHAGQEIHYTYTVTNTGEVFTLHDVTVSDDRIRLPVHCAATTLAPGEHTTCTATYTITQEDVDAGHVANVAVATGTTPNGDVVPSKPAGKTVHARRHPAISIVKTASVDSFAAAGLEITYYYRVTNTGNVTLVATEHDSRDLEVICPRRALLPGQSMTCRSYYVTTEADADAGHIDNIGYVTGVTTYGTEVHASDPLDIPQEHRPEISIVKTASVDSFAAAGTPVTYYYLVANNGNVALHQVSVTDSQGLAVGCPDATLAINEEMTCTARYVTTQADVDLGTIGDTGTVTGTDPDGTRVTDDGTLTIAAVHAPEISIVKTASAAGFTAAGQPVTYYYLVTNNGNVTLHQVTVTDSRGLALSCPHASLAVGQATTCTARYVTTQADVSAGSILNAGTVTGRTPAGTRVLAEASAFLPFTGTPYVPVTG
jgi:uncharacterized repeat protein (TIGR01451 family)